MNKYLIGVSMSMRKGIELPTNFLVILAIAVIVLLAAATLFFFVWRPGSTTVRDQGAFNIGCSKLLLDCTKDPSTIKIEGYKCSASGASDEGNTLLDACICLGYRTEEICKQKCGCPK
jgi:hypothetical protein